MKNILKQILILLLFFGLVFVIAYFLVSKFMPLSDPGRLDTELNKGIFGVNDAFQLVIDRAPLKSHAPKIIFLGSSNARIGFRPQQFLTYFPGYEVHNMCLGGSNLSQVKKVVELAYEVMPQEAQKKTIFVLGFWYGDLADGDNIWKSKRMPVENEELRYGLYRQKGGEIQPLIPQEYFPYYMKFLYPFLALNQAFGNVPVELEGSFEALCRKFLKSTNKHPAADNDVEHIVVDESNKVRGLDHWHQSMGGDKYKGSHRQWLVLDELAHRILQHGSKLVIVDMPLPHWHQVRSVDYAEYQRNKWTYLKAVTSLQGVYYINMQDLNNDLDYYDAAHIKPHVTYQWSDRLAKELKRTVF